MRGSYDLVRLGNARFLGLITKVLQAELGIGGEPTWGFYGYSGKHSVGAMLAEQLRFQERGIKWGPGTRVQVAFHTPSEHGDTGISWLRQRIRDDLGEIGYSAHKVRQVLYITNVTLDGPSDYTYELLREGARKIALHDALLWSADEIGKLLDRHHRVRSSAMSPLTCY